MARKPKLNKEMIETAAKLIAAGNYMSTVYTYLGISHETWFRWLRQGEKQEKGIYRDFYEAIKKAEAQAEARNVAVIQEAAKTTWQAAAWFLERKYPERWGKRDTTVEDIKKQQQEVVKKIEEIVRALNDDAEVQQQTEGIYQEGEKQT